MITEYHLCLLVRRTTIIVYLQAPVAMGLDSQTLRLTKMWLTAYAPRPARPHAHPTWETVPCLRHTAHVKPVHLPKCMMVPSTPNASDYIIYACNDNSCTMCSGGLDLTQWDLANTVCAMHNMSPGFREDQVDCQNAVKKSNDNSNSGWQEDLTVPDGYFAIH